MGSASRQRPARAWTNCWPCWTRASPRGWPEVELLLPYDKLALLAPLRQGGSVQAEEYRDDGVYVKALADRRSLHLFEPYLLYQ